MYIKPFGKDLVCSVVCSDLGFVFLFFFFSVAFHGSLGSSPQPAVKVSG